MQKTDFAFKVVVNDDASTDKTAEIIREFEQKYPDIIKPIYQTENQFSKKISIYKEFLLPQIEGDYVAFLEGDDYWTDPDKLQIQANFLDSHPQCSACGHNAKILKMNKTARNEHKGDICGGKEGYLSAETIILNGFILHLNSIMYRSKFADFPDFVYARYDLLDMPMSVYLRFCGEIYRFDKVMSVYRFLVPGSWTVKQKENIPDEKHQKLIAFFKEADKYSDYKYTNEFARQIIFEASCLTDSKNVVFSEYKHLYKSLPLSLKFKYIIKIKFPPVFRLLKATRNFIRKLY
jgi:glycosyltransferase involved in cell wall biosynthesis